MCRRFNPGSAHYHITSYFKRFFHWIPVYSGKIQQWPKLAYFGLTNRVLCCGTCCGMILYPAMYTPKDIWPDKTSFPEWFPKDFTARQAKILAPFTPHRDGWVRRYKG